MPFLPLIRKASCCEVKEYILIGEADGGICGHPLLTWGGNTMGDDPDQAVQREHNCMDVAGAPDQAHQTARICTCTLASCDELGDQLRCLLVCTLQHIGLHLLTSTWHLKASFKFSCDA